MTDNPAAAPGDEPDYDEAEFGRRSPQRRCLASGATRTKDEMIRFVVAPDGEVVPDLEESLPGRGMWITADRAALELAVRRNLFSRGARRAARAPADLPARVAALLRRRCLAHLGLARRAGQAVAGFEKARALLQKGEAAVLIAAGDGAPDGRAKLKALAGGLPLVEKFTAAELAAALGREHVVHAALTESGIARRLLLDAERLKGLNGTDAHAGPAAEPRNDGTGSV